MPKYTIKFSPEYYATSLWAVSKNAYEDLGCGIQYEKLLLSKELIKRLEQFDDRILDIIDWNNPGAESPLSKAERKTIWDEGQQLLIRIRAELGEDFEVIDESDWVK